MLCSLTEILWWDYGSVMVIPSFGKYTIHIACGIPRQASLLLRIPCFLEIISKGPPLYHCITIFRHDTMEMTSLFEVPCLNTMVYDYGNLISMEYNHHILNHHYTVVPRVCFCVNMINLCTFITTWTCFSF